MVEAITTSVWIYSVTGKNYKERIIYVQENLKSLSHNILEYATYDLCCSNSP